MIHDHRINNGIQTIRIRIFEEGKNKENTIFERTITMKEFIYNQEKE